MILRGAETSSAQDKSPSRDQPPMLGLSIVLVQGEKIRLKDWKSKSLAKAYVLSHRSASKPAWLC